MRNSLKVRHIIVFTRYPRPGVTKTRLIPYLGAVGAANLHKNMVEEVVKTAIQASIKLNTHLTVYFTGGSHKQMRSWLGKQVRLQKQASGSLGEKMSHAFEDSHQMGFKQTILLGSDIPGLSVETFTRTFDELSRHDLVLGPSLDGGYYLIAMGQPVAVFHEIPWGGREVMKKTQQKIQSLSLSCSYLSPENDIDTIEDLQKWNPEAATRLPYISVVIPALNEEKQVSGSIISALNDEAEIILVDGGSKDQTISIAKGLGARVLNTKRGRAIQQNSGASIARGKVLLFLHADSCLPKNYINSVFEALMEPDTVLGAFRFKTDLDHGFMRVYEFVTQIRSTLFHRPYGDQGIFCRQALFTKLGGFPQSPIAEDLLLVKKMKNFGGVKTLSQSILTSGRRWKQNGYLKPFLINQLVLLGLMLKVSPEHLSKLYRFIESK